MKGTDKNTWASGVRLRTRRVGPVLFVLCLLAFIAPVTALAAKSSALHRAVKAGDLDGVTRMLAAGADVNARDNRDWTALMYAVDKGYLLLVEPLLAAQADPNVRGPDGSTPLFIAVVRDHEEIIPMLMQAGADPTIKGLKGKTATEVAQMRYGDPLTALKQGKPPEVVALLAGKMWAKGAEFVRMLGMLAELQLGQTFRECEQCPELVVVPPGNFMMGSPSSEAGRDGDEGPVHQVTIVESFAVGKYEVTFAEWDACVKAGGCTYRPGDEGWGRETRPVINVSWDDAQAYVAWLSRETGQRYRLLSEAEWEYMARAGTQTARYWGESEAGQCAYGNGADRAARRSYSYSDGTVAKCDDGYVQTAPVGRFEANAFGLFDTAGNVWEWVADCWHDSYRDAPSDGSAWKGGDCGRRVLRGGCWGHFPRFLRAANRNRSDPGARYDVVGLRVARTLTP